MRKSGTPDVQRTGGDVNFSPTPCLYVCDGPWQQLRISLLQKCGPVMYFSLGITRHFSCIVDIYYYWTPSVCPWRCTLFSSLLSSPQRLVRVRFLLGLVNGESQQERGEGGVRSGHICSPESPSLCIPGISHSFFSFPMRAVTVSLLPTLSG